MSKIASKLIIKCINLKIIITIVRFCTHQPRFHIVLLLMMLQTLIRVLTNNSNFHLEWDHQSAENFQPSKELALGKKIIKVQAIY